MEPPPEPARDPALAAALLALIDAGRAAHPQISLDQVRFEEHVLLRAPAEIAALAKLHAADLWLACACALGDAAALRSLDALYLHPLAAQLHSAATPADELQQALRERLLVAGQHPPRIAEYAKASPPVAPPDWDRAVQPARFTGLTPSAAAPGSSAGAAASSWWSRSP